MGSISVVDATGIIRHSTQPLIVGQSRRDDRRSGSSPPIRKTADRQQPFPTVVEPKTFVIPFARPLLDDRRRVSRASWWRP